MRIVKRLINLNIKIRPLDSKRFKRHKVYKHISWHVISSIWHHSFCHTVICMRGNITLVVTKIGALFLL